MRTFFVIHVIYFSCIAASNPHTPKVYENNLENLNSPPKESIRSPRQSSQNDIKFRPLTFDFARAQMQQDMLKLKYFQQQKSNFESYRRNFQNPKVAKLLDNFLEKRRDAFRLDVPFEEEGWVPITSKNIAQKSFRDLQDISDGKQSESGDLQSADSEMIETKVKPTLAERKDIHGKYIYIQPSILKNNFGLDSKTAQEILKKSAPKLGQNVNQLQAIEDLLTKNQQQQLEGLQKLLREASVFSGQQTSNLDSMQETLEEGTQQQQSEDAFTLAQREAEAHLQAQHKAIELAQQKLQKEALAKIAAHNKGQINIDPKQLAQMQEEAIAHLKQLEPYSGHKPQISVNTLSEPNTFGGYFQNQANKQNQINANLQETLRYNGEVYQQPLQQHQINPSFQGDMKFDQGHVHPSATPNINQHTVFLQAPRHLLKEVPNHLQEHQRQVFFASTPTPHTLSSPTNYILEHSPFFLASTPRPIERQLFPSSTPQNNLLRHRGQAQKLYVQPNEASPQQTVYQNIPQHPEVDVSRANSFIPPSQIQPIAVPPTASVIKQQTSRPKVSIQQTNVYHQVPLVFESHVQQTQRPQIWTSDAQKHHEAIHHQTQTRANLQHVSVLSTPAPTKLQTPKKYDKHVAYSSQVNHIPYPNGALVAENPNLGGAVPTQAFLRGNDVSTVGYAPFFRTPAQKQSVSYVNVVQESPKEIRAPDLQTKPVHYVATVSPTIHQHHVSGQGPEHHDVPDSQLNYDDYHQYAANYAFGYKIADHKHGNDYGHEEKKDGKNTKGHYYVNLPDGRRQKVEYFVDDNGYHAEVSYENIATHKGQLSHE